MPVGLIPLTMWQTRACFPFILYHFTGEVVERQSDQAACLGSHV